MSITLPINDTFHNFPKKSMFIRFSIWKHPAITYYTYGRQTNINNHILIVWHKTNKACGFDPSIRQKKQWVVSATVLKSLGKVGIEFYFTFSQYEGWTLCIVFMVRNCKLHIRFSDMVYHKKVLSPVILTEKRDEDLFS